MNLKLLLSAFISGILLITATGSVMAKDLTISGGVRPQPQDLSVSFTSDPPPGSILKHKHLVTYTFTYQSQLSTPASLILSASWQNPSLPTSPFSYIVDSASSSANVTPVIDLNNKTITWQIDLSSAMNYPETVSFQLQDSINREDITETTVTGISTVFNYPYSQTEIPFHFFYTPPPPSPNNDIALTGTPTPFEATSTPVTPPTSPPKISSIEITDIKDNSASITIYTDTPTTAKLRYGNSLPRLNETIRSPQNGKYHQFQLTNLSSSSIYYFEIEVTGSSGKRIVSDIFILNTAQPDSKISLPDVNTIIISDNFSYDLAPLTTYPLEERFVGISADYPLSISIHIPNSDSIRKVIGYFENAQILGINTFSNSIPREKAELNQETNEFFSNTLRTPTLPGNYRFALQITDTKGGLLTYYLPFNFRIYSPLRIVDQKTQRPIEDAIVKITPANQARYRSYTSNEAGQVNLTLLPGEYTINIEGAGYLPLSTDLNISHSTNTLPTVFLNSKNNLIGYSEIVTHSLKTSFIYLNYSYQHFFNSRIAYNASIFITIIIALISLIITFIPTPSPKKQITHLRLLHYLLHQTAQYLINFFVVTTIVVNFSFYLASPSTISLWSLIPLLLLIVTSIIRLQKNYRHRSY